VAERALGGLHCVEAADMAPAFVLGSLEPDEAAAVRAHLAACSAPHPEFEELGSVVPALLESVPMVDPPESLRTRLLGAAAAMAPTSTRAARVSASDASAPTEGTVRADRAVVRPISPVGPVGQFDPIGPIDRPVVRRDSNRPSRISTLLAMAAVLAIVVLGAWNVMLQGQLGAAGRYADALTATLQLAARPGSAMAVLAPTTTGGPAGLAAIRRPAARCTRPGRSAGRALRSRSADSPSAPTAPAR
jgi:hypothetical protein